MKTFGKLERDGAPTRSPALTPGPSTPGRNEPPAEQPVMSASLEKPVMSASLRERVIEQIEPSVAATVSREVLRRQIEEIIHGIANQERLELSGREQLQLADELADDMTGYGPLRPLLLDDSINDVMVNGPSNVYVERRGKLERVAIRFRDNDHIASVAQKIAGRVGRRVDESSPMVDCRLPDGSRVNIIFPPLAIHSPCIQRALQAHSRFAAHNQQIDGVRRASPNGGSETPSERRQDHSRPHNSDHQAKEREDQQVGRRLPEELRNRQGNDREQGHADNFGADPDRQGSMRIET